MDAVTLKQLQDVLTAQGRFLGKQEQCIQELTTQVTQLTTSVQQLTLQNPTPARLRVEASTRLAKPELKILLDVKDFYSNVSYISPPVENLMIKPR